MGNGTDEADFCGRTVRFAPPAPQVELWQWLQGAAYRAFGDRDDVLGPARGEALLEAAAAFAGRG